MLPLNSRPSVACTPRQVGPRPGGASPRQPSPRLTRRRSPGTRLALASDPAITLLKNEAATALLQYDLESLLTIGNAPAPERTVEQ